MVSLDPEDLDLVLSPRAPTFFPRTVLYVLSRKSGRNLVLDFRVGEEWIGFQFNYKLTHFTVRREWFSQLDPHLRSVCLQNKRCRKVQVIGNAKSEMNQHPDESFVAETSQRR